MSLQTLNKIFHRHCEDRPRFCGQDEAISGREIATPCFARLAMTVLLSVLSLMEVKSVYADTSEVLPKTNTSIMVREHPKTGKPYVSIVRAGQTEPTYVFQRGGGKFSRPDYRMLDPNVKSKEIFYDGPVSSRKKVYALAASLAAGGALGAALLPVAPATGAAAGGAGAYAAAGTGVAAGTVSAAALKTRVPPDQDDFEQSSETKIKNHPST